MTTFLATGGEDEELSEGDGLCGSIPLVVSLAAGGGGGEGRTGRGEVYV
jgi:hypothetical protein